MRFAVQTFFDITATGVTGHFKPSRIPFRDFAGNMIVDQESWNRSRNQQRNWETITQILSLRTQLFRLSEPIVDSTNSMWFFEFETETDGIYGDATDSTAILRSDADGVPMLTGLDNKAEVLPFIVASGPNQNIWFAQMDINMSLEN